MSITSAKSGATGISLALENNFMEPIASTLVGSGGSSVITFNDIPQTYKHLQLRVFGGNSTTFQCIMQFNSDTATNYSSHRLTGTGAATASAARTTVNSLNILSYGGLYFASSIASASVVDILDYTNTNKYKTTRSLSGWDANGSGYVEFESGLWQSTVAINSINLSMGSGIFAQNTRASLYGIKG